MRICTLTLRVLILDDKKFKNRVDSHGASYRILETVRRQNADCFFAVLSFCHDKLQRKVQENGGFI